MELRSIQYRQYANTPRSWTLEKCDLGNINLIVGRNATGKTKTLNVIKALALMFSKLPKLQFFSGDFTVIFEKRKKTILYKLRYEKTQVLKEELIIDNVIMMKRGISGKGELYSSKLDRKLEFQIPKNEIAIMSKRDAIQHPFIQDLNDWGKNLMHFAFGSQLGKDRYSLLEAAAEEKSASDLSDTDNVTTRFKHGANKYGKSFVHQIRQDMTLIGYTIDKIEVGPPRSLKIQLNHPGQPVGLVVKENDLIGETDQQDMSQGMFRALSVIIQINYAIMIQSPSCILIDDVGEGLDYERSSSLIKLLIEKVKGTNVQLIMSTNDRFVMNNVPLQYWTVINRKGNKSKTINYKNNKKLFEEFELTGLNNFDFFSSKYFMRTGRR